MAKKEEAAVDAVQNVAEPAVQENLQNVEVPDNAEEITQEQALAEAAVEVNKLREENTAIKQELDKKNTEFQELVAKNNEEAEIAAKQILELEEKVKAFEENKETASDNGFYLKLLEQFEAKIDEYAGLRRERLRKEFIIDLKEEIQRQKDTLKNA